MIKRENYMKRIRPFIDTKLVKVLTGLRRSGKSVIMRQIRDELIEKGVPESNCLTFDFEDLRLFKFRTALALHEEVLRRVEGLTGKVYLFFDEIQFVEEWEQCINSLRVLLDSDIYVTGSNAKLLSGELATVLTGRHVTINIYPFSFAEFIKLYETVCPGHTTEEMFKTYLIYGGLPEVATCRYEEGPSVNYLRDTFYAIRSRDIVDRHKIRDKDLLDRLMIYVTANIANTFSATSISKYLKNEQISVSTTTILEYLRYGCDACLFHRVKREDLQGKRLLSTNEKYYIADHGFRKTIFANPLQDINAVLENVVYIEMLRRGYEVNVGKSGNQEVDFVCTNSSGTVYIQVTYLLASEATIEREFGVLRNITDGYPKYVLSMDTIDMSRDGFRHMNIIQFLLNEEI